MEYKVKIAPRHPSLLLFALLFTATLANFASDTGDDWMGRILIAEDPSATSAFTPQAAPIAKMVESGITTFTGQPSPAAAWLSLVTTNDIVGLKVVSASGASGTRKPVVEAVIKGLLEAGLARSQIVVWDRRLSDLRQAGYIELAERHGVRISGAQEAGYDESRAYETPLLGRLVFGDHEFNKVGDNIGRRSFATKLVTTNITKIINIVPLMNHNLAGVVGCLHSLALGSVDNTLRFESDPDRLGTAVPEIFAMEPILDKTVLHIVDALIAQSQGEERTLLHYSTAMNELWFSRDPVALDVLSLEELGKQRKQAAAPPLRTNPDIFGNAALLDLGSANSAKFRIERLRAPAITNPQSSIINRQ